MTHIPDKPTIETAALAVARHFPESLKGAVPILGVSGGRDSMLLMFVFARLFADKYIHEQPVVFHLDHRLRPDSGADAELVRRVSADMDLPLYLEAKDCAAFARRTGRGTEDAGRLLRYRCMERVGRQFQRFYAVTAHHADDYVESLLLHLCRGGGPGSLGTMGLVSRLQNMLVFRPFMPFTRDYISDVVAGASIPFHDDPTNALPDVRRNRIRWDVIPALRREGLDPSLLWENFHDQTDDMDVTRPPASHVMIDRRMFQGASRSAVKRALDVGLASLGLSPAPRTMTTAVARGFSLEGQDPAAPGRFQFYTKDVLLWAGSTTPLWMIPARSALYEKPVALPEDDGGAVRVSYAGRHKTVVLEPGETMQCFSPGLRARMKDGTHKKLKDLLQESHLPPPVRLNLPLIVGADGFVKIILFSFWEDLRDRHCH